jgi:hypothetical protein
MTHIPDLDVGTEQCSVPTIIEVSCNLQVGFRAALTRIKPDNLVLHEATLTFPFCRVSHPLGMGKPDLPFLRRSGDGEVTKRLVKMRIVIKL